MSSDRAFEERTAAAIAKYQMFKQGSAAVAFSGGADSVALLYYLSQRFVPQGLRLYAVHIHHGIRAAEADRDEAFCRSFCADQHIPYFCFRFDVPRLSQASKEGLEVCARRVRYEALQAFCEEKSVGCIATAHHAQDNLETLLFNLIRGSALRGAGGIPPTRGNIVRPLIFCRKEDIEGYIRRNSLSYVTDSSNLDQRFARNKIRHTVLPALLSVNTGAVDHAAQFCEGARDDENFLREFSEKSKTTYLPDCRALHPSILNRVACMLYEEAFGVLPERKHIEALIELIKTGTHGARRDFSSGRSVVIDRDHVCFHQASALAAQPENEYFYELHEGENKLTEINCMAYLCRQALPAERLEVYSNIYKKSIHIVMNSDKIKRVYLRPKRAKDSYSIAGITKKVKKMLQEDKLTLRQRVQRPVFCDEAGALWLPGHPPRDGMSAESGLHIYFFTGA